MDKLIFCPFCGSTNVRLTIYVRGYCGHCNDCQAEGPIDLGESGAIERWNHRVMLPWHPFPETHPEKESDDVGEEYLCWIDYPFNRIAALDYRYEKWWSIGQSRVDWTERVTHFCALTSLSIPPGVEENG